MAPENLVAADYVGMVSGRATDKSGVFTVFYGELGTAPLIQECPLSMECRLHDVYDLPTHDVMIGEVVATYADDAVLSEGRVDIAKARPLLFDMGSRKYWSLGPAVGDCWRSRQEVRGLSGGDGPGTRPGRLTRTAADSTVRQVIPAQHTTHGRSASCLVDGDFPSVFP